MRKVLGAGAEATIYLDGKSVDKERSRKNYRHEDIDSVLRKNRTRKEAKILRSLEHSGFVPKLIEQKDHDIIMEYVDGIQLKKLLDKDPKLAALIGKNLTYMHDKNIIHGDLTTSNMILTGKRKSQRLFFIDFGLSYNSTRIEDKAVDIHLFKQALESKHFKINDKAYKYFLKEYNPKDKKDILTRLEIVEQRGRYKEKT
jgi:Kae1-associated kinase Bud32